MIVELTKDTIKKKILSEFAWYIAQKEQPISMGNCLSFARLVIRGCGQPLYKRFHHRKMVAGIKRQYNECKNNLLTTFRYVNYKVSITSDIWTAGQYGLGYSCVAAHYIDENWIYKKNFKFSYHGISVYCTDYLSIYY
jgi:hypothetical protein